MRTKPVASIVAALVLGFASAAMAGEGSVDSRNVGPSYWPYGPYVYGDGYVSGGIVLDPGYAYVRPTPGIVYDDYNTGYWSGRRLIAPNAVEIEPDFD